MGEVAAAAAAEEIAAGIAATDLLSVDVIRSRVRRGARNRRTCVCLLIRPNSVIPREAHRAEPRDLLFYLPFGTQSRCPMLAAALSRQGWDALPNTSHGTPASHREARVEEGALAPRHGHQLAGRPSGVPGLVGPRAGDAAANVTLWVIIRPIVGTKHLTGLT